MIRKIFVVIISCITYKTSKTFIRLRNFKMRIPDNFKSNRSESYLPFTCKCGVILMSSFSAES